MSALRTAQAPTGKRNRLKGLKPAATPIRYAGAREPHFEIQRGVET
jgi:hypothetical protein